MTTPAEEQFAAALDRLVFGDAVGHLPELRLPQHREMVQTASRLAQELVPAVADADFRAQLRAHLMVTPLERRESPLGRVIDHVKWPDWERSRWVAVGAAAGVAAVAVGLALARQRAGLPGESEI